MVTEARASGDEIMRAHVVWLRHLRGFHAEIFSDRKFLLEEIVIQGHYLDALRTLVDPIEARAGNGTVYFVDAGANVGLVSLFASHLFRRRLYSIGFEPLPANFRLCQGNWSSLRHELRAEALSDRAGTVDLHVRSTTGATIIAREAEIFAAKYRMQPPTVPVPTTRLDDALVGKRIPRIDVIKLDVEGAEEAALAGAVETIRRDEPVILCSYEHPSNDPERICALISACGLYEIINDRARKLLVCAPKRHEAGRSP